MTPHPHHRAGGGYQNPWPGSNPRGFSHLVRWFVERNFIRRPPPDPDRSVFAVERPALGQAVRPGDLAVTWIGHSTALLEFSGLTVLTDPVFGEHASPIPTASLRRWVDPPVGVADLPRLDAVLLSHNHYDHLDAPTVRQLAALQPEAVWCTPLGNAGLLQRLGVKRVQELDWWEDTGVAGATIGCVPAQHFSARGLHDRSRALWGGLTVRFGGRSAYFVGDTAYHPDFAAIGRRAGPFDLVLMPVGAYEPRWFMHVVHLNPEEAVRAFGELSGGSDGEGTGAAGARPRPVMVPIHWGTFKLTDEDLREPPQLLREIWQEQNRRQAQLEIPAIGQTLRF